MEFNALHQVDCIEGMATLESGAVDLVFADPPFNIGYDYDVYDDRRRSEEYLAWTKRWGQQVSRVLKPDGTFWLAIGDEYAADLKVLFHRELGLTCRSWVVWYYTFGVNCKKKFNRSHTHFFHFVKDPKKFTFNTPEIKIPSARQLVYADSRAELGGKLPDDTWILRPQDLKDGFEATEDTWYFPRVCGTFKERAGWHGCQMPEQLLGRIIRVSSNPGEIVLDPFAGSGTSLVVAKKLSRPWIGFEISPNYVEQVRGRIAAVTEGQPLEGAPEPKVSAPSTAAGKIRPDVELLKALRNNRRKPEDFDRGIVEAFLACRNGFSVDRVIADPELNQDFRRICKYFGLPGEQGDWNRRLMNLRKASILSGLPRSRKTTFPTESIDRYSFACEIAIEQLARQELTLDHVLCEPTCATKLDELVRHIVPEKIPSLLIRWIALRIRKAASGIREASSNKCLNLPRKDELVRNLDLKKIPSQPAVYWLSAQAKLYVGETLDLRQRFELQFSEDTPFDFWGTDREDHQIRFRVLSGSPSDVKETLNGTKSSWIRRWNPIGNYSQLAAAI